MKMAGNGPPRSSFEMPDTIARLCLNRFGAADFASLTVRSEAWWRRRESNKRLCSQPSDIPEEILKRFFADSIWIVFHTGASKSIN